jgi:D-glycero-alpha-D-manno-heptose-7-phosphate kinase
LLADDWNLVGEILRRSHPERKRLSPNMTTPQMDKLIETAYANGAIAAKVCGAGGGGCIAFFCEDGRRADVERSLASEEGAEVLDWELRNEGLTVREVSAGTA